MRLVPVGLGAKFSGPRWIAGIYWEPPGVELGHGDPESDRGRVVVGVQDHPHLDARAGMPLVHDRLALGLVDIPTAEALDSVAWSTVSLSVDGRARKFDYLAGRDAEWGAVIELEDGWIEIHARDIPSEGLELVTMDEVDPYLVGLPRR